MERQLRSFLKHERMTVRMSLVEALHHRCGVGPDGTPKTASKGGGRPGVLKEPEPPLVVEHVACPCFGVPLFAIPLLGGGADGVDHTTAAYLLHRSL